MANYLDFPVTTTGSSPDKYELYFQYNGGISGNGFWKFGYDADVSKWTSSAFRFTNVTVGQGVSVVDARLYLPMTFRSGTEQIKCVLKGIKETNTADFSSSPFGRAETTATQAFTYDSSGLVTTIINVTSIVNEIFAQGGWSSGNYLGFLSEDNGTTNASGNEYVGADTASGPSTAYLSILVSSNPTFTPTPVTVGVGSKTPSEQYGIKIVEEGNSALTLSNENKSMIISSSHPILKVKKQGSTTVTATKSIPHLLPYSPAFLAYINDGTGSTKRKYKLPSTIFLDKATSLSAFASSDPTNLDLSLYEEVYVQGGGQESYTQEFYYYIFIDEL